MKFDYHGACDLVLLAHPNFAGGLVLQIHIRTRSEKWWSYIESAVVQIGTQLFELEGGDNGETARFWVNGLGGNAETVENDVKMLENELQTTLNPHFKVHYKHVSSKQHKFRIDLSGTGDAISLETYKKWIKVTVKAKKPANFLGAMGLMGAYPSGSTVGRDGVTVYDTDKDANAFGQVWQVLPDEPMLFHKPGPVKPSQQCVLPDQTKQAAEKKRRLCESLVTVLEAEEACDQTDTVDRDACIADVLATNDRGMAGAY